MYTEGPRTHLPITCYLLFFCKMLKWAIQQLRLVMSESVSWTGRGKILLQREVFSFLDGNRKSREFDKGVENTSSEVLKCYYKSLHKKSQSCTTPQDLQIKSINFKQVKTFLYK